MPFTPFHLGPAVLIGLFLRKYIDFPTFVAANLVVDLRATLIFFGLMEGTLHGFLHTFLFGSLLGIALGSLMYRIIPSTSSFMKFFELEQLTDFGSFIAAGVLGTGTHVLLDSFLYTDIQPLTPLNTNPFYGIIPNPNSLVYGFTIVSFFIGAIYYFHIYSEKLKTNV
ncbi:MAG: hydrolase [Candidatus Nanohaloarchaea archaeon]